jgi:hypothetical protein
MNCGVNNMSWSKVGGFLKSVLPIAATALTGGGAGIVGSLLSAAMGVDDNPDAVMAKLKSDPEAILKYKLAELETNRDVIIEAQKVDMEKLKTVNETYRVEINSGDPFVRRWRPFYGYCVAVSWLIQMMGFTFVFGYTAIKNPDKLMLVIQQFAVLSGSLIALWGIALAVLGVSVHKRSQDKVGDKAKGFLARFIK